MDRREDVSLQAKPTWKVGIIHSKFYEDEMNELVKSAVDTLHTAGIPKENIVTVAAAGSFEIPLLGAALAKAGTVDALIGLGIIVEGETHHARLLAEQSARGIMDVQVQYTLPFAFEILYVNSIADAKQRLDKGKEAAVAVIESLTVLEGLKS